MCNALKLAFAKMRFESIYSGCRPREAPDASDLPAIDIFVCFEVLTLSK